MVNLKLATKLYKYIVIAFVSLRGVRKLAAELFVMNAKLNFYYYGSKFYNFARKNNYTMHTYAS